MSAPVVHKRKAAQARQAYARLKSELDALPAAEVRSINLNVSETIEVVLASLPRLEALRPAMTRELPTFDQGLLGKLEDCAQALKIAHARYTSVPPKENEGALMQAKQLRKILIADAAALCAHGHLPASQLRKASPTFSYESMAQDLEYMVALFSAVLPSIQGKSAVCVADLDRANELIIQLRAAQSDRKSGTLIDAQAIDARNRAFTLLTNTYAEVRRVVIFLCANEADAASLMPRLFGGRREECG